MEVRDRREAILSAQGERLATDCAYLMTNESSSIKK